ncbi:transforming growth factor beta activator LRRC33-like [Anguilla rostrata]|uniref:transforming growth factor beta activator LRRC33-like n=1 Tax=Anguilla rostrata TaxID=7938 RepID=UPI0030CD7284
MPLLRLIPCLACLALSLIWDVQLPAASHAHCQLTQQAALCKDFQLSSVPTDLPKNIKELQLNNNPIRVLKNTSLSCCPHLKVLSCASCCLETIEAHTFHNALNIENLNLAKNHIHTGYQQTSQALWHLAQLKVLDLSENGLTENMVSLFLHNMSSLERLSLSGNIMLRLDQTIFHNLHRLEELNMESNALFEIEGGAFNSLQSLQRLNLAFNNLLCLVNFRLTRLLVLNASHNNLEWFISDQDVKEPFHLQTLDLRDNRLLFFPFLPTLSHVQTLLLSDNQIGFYQHFANISSLNWTTHVQFFNLYGNISNVTVELWDETLHGDISSVELLDLTGNRVVYFPRGFLGKMQKLTRLKLGRNCLESLDLKELSASLYELDLSSNRLTMLSASQTTLDALAYLTHLNLSLNDLQRLPTRLFVGLSSLTTVDLSYNKVDICSSEDLDSCTDDCDCVIWTDISSLKQLYLRGCSLRQIPPFAFNGTTITHLELSDNPQIFLSQESLAGLNGTLQQLGLGNTKTQAFDFTPFIHLRSLDISKNSLSHLPGIPPLRWLDLRDNSLTSIPFQQAETLSSSLHTVFLGGNPFNCCDMDWYRMLEEVNTVNIMDWPDVTCLHAVHGTNMVDRLSGNLCRMSNEEPSGWYVALLLVVCLTFVGIIVIFTLTFRSSRVPGQINKRCMRATSY